MSNNKKTNSMDKSFLSKKFVYFHIDELNRDAVTASALRKELWKRNIRVIYGGRIYSIFVRYFASFFDAVIFPKPHFLKYAKKTLFEKARIAILYTENIVIIASDENEKMVLKGALDREFMAGDPDYVDMVSAFCFWGGAVHDTVVKHYPYLQEKCHIVGHPRHSKDALPGRRKVESSSAKKTIGLITRHTYFNDYYDHYHSKPLARLARYLDDSPNYEYYNKKTNDYLLFERRGYIAEDDLFIEALDAKNLFIIAREALKNNYNVSIKVHPRERVETWVELFKEKGVNVSFVDSTTPFTYWLSEIDYLIGPPSTSFYDCLMCGVTPISTHNLDKRRNEFIASLYEENNKLMKYIAAPESISELLSLIKSEPGLQYAKEINDVLLREADYPHCSDSIYKVANIVEDITQNNKQGVFTRWGAVTVYFILSKIINFLYLLRNFKSMKRSNSFVVTRYIKKFIDNLARS